MSRHVSVLKPIYLSERASEQKSKCLDFFLGRYPSNGRTQHCLLYLGIESFLARDPFTHSSTQPFDGIDDGYISKIPFGIEPLLVTIIFTDNFADGRQLEGISLSTIDEKRIFY